MATTRGFIKSNNELVHWDGKIGEKMIDGDINIERNGYSKNIKINIVPNESIMILTENGHNPENLETRLKTDLLIESNNHNIKLLGIKMPKPKSKKNGNTKQSKTRKKRTNITIQKTSYQ